MFKSITRANQNTQTISKKKLRKNNKNNYPPENKKYIHISPYSINCSVKDSTKKEDKHLKITQNYLI